MTNYIVYGDLNCPFSYALYELLYSQNLLAKVEWRLVEHSSGTGSYLGATESMSELASEIFDIRNKAPDLAISLPRKRGDSLFPTLCVISSQTVCAERAQILLHNLYRALWVDGKDISSSSVIFDALEDAGLPTEVDTEGHTEEVLQSWQSEWEQGNYGLRTPAILASDGRRLLGLVNHQTVFEFLQGVDIAPTAINSASRYQEKMTIAIFSDAQISSLWSMIASLRDESNILLPQSLQALHEMLLSDERCPDLILLQNTDQSSNLHDLCRDMAHLTREKQIPLVVIGEAISDAEEVQLYESGIADYLLQSRDPTIIQVRINMQLKLKQSYDQLAKAASIDTLTQVYNRREFERCFETEWRRGLRSRQPLSLILLDIDNFKAFNDKLGHINGDNCLRQIGTLLRESARRAQDRVCRFGGEEFILLLPDTDQKGALSLAETIRKRIIDLNIRHSPSFKDQPVSASFGVATVITAHKESSPGMLLENADNALYKAKKNGRNRVELFARSDESAA